MAAAAAAAAAVAAGVAGPISAGKVGADPSLSPSPSPSPSSSKSPAADSSPGSELEPSSPNSDPCDSKNVGAPPPGRKISAARRLPPPCWTQEETGALIQAYRQKWYALRRGNLRAPHWEEVADAVASRCRHLYAAAGSPKTAVQCRHKMEKLRKRYRSEKRRPHRTSWVHFREMDAMEMGTPSGGTGSGGGPTSAAKGAAPPPPPFPENFSGEEDNDRDGSDEEEEDDDDDDDDGERNGGVMSILANGGKPIDDLRFQVPKVVRTKADHWGNPKSHNAGGSNGCFKGFPGVPERKAAPLAAAAVVRKRVEERRRKEREPAALEEVAAAVRILGDGFLRAEEMKMEMAREMEKLRMDMELKRTELVLESQRWIVDAFVKGIWHGKKKRARVSPDSH
ncbi:unnamed protein product [Spirodela intermedia]|uniref:Myb/SANT-like DNA-binding domain-containing protein n=1 Tax=Spirodela intermedia TaxID=51605 RepID=A0A7I8LNT7_SPIIN|nr:unnamed protein product [Spirodela intermedia]